MDRHMIHGSMIVFGLFALWAVIVTAMYWDGNSVVFNKQLNEILKHEQHPRSAPPALKP